MKNYTGREYKNHIDAIELIEQCESERQTELDLSSLRLSKLPPQIFRLKHLMSLILYDNKLADFPTEILELDNLQKLDLGRNRIVELPLEIAKLRKLRSLSIWENSLEAFPLELVGLSSLSELLLDGNALRFIPDEISQLETLRTLSLSGCQLDELPRGVCVLRNLSVLNISRNYLTRLPSDVGRLQKLTKLELTRNKLASLPVELSNLRKLSKLYLHGNPNLQIPVSILGATPHELEVPARPKDILNFYFSQRQAEESGTSRALNEIKVMLVGRGGAGKTSIRRFFMGEAHNREEPETPGIALDTFELDCPQGRVTVRLWDFAGQEITHALHKFFLTEGCIYILVLDPRSNTEMHDAEYWLALLKRYGGNAPVLLALNRQDARQGGYDVDRRFITQKYPFVKGFARTNCEDRHTCLTLREMLCVAVESLGETEPPRLKVPESWLNVISKCDDHAVAHKAVGGNRFLAWLGWSEHPVAENNRRHYMTLDDFREICADCGETSSEKQESLARLLHKLGAVLHFVDEPRLRNTAVLNPHWVTDGVYRLLRYKDTPASDGVLSIKEALDALPSESESSARFLLRLMERFDMCFPLDDKESDELPTRWLIPGALGEFQPEGIGAEWLNRNSVRMRYVYDPLPEGVLPRFIVMTNLLSEGKPRWRNGVIVEEGQAKALIRRGDKRDHVEVVAVGQEEDRLRILEIVQGTLERINGDLPDPKPIAEIEIAGYSGVYRSVADLEAAELGRQKVAVDTREGRVLVEPTWLLNHASEPESRNEARVPLRTLLSYSYKDKRAKSVFQDNLTVLMKKKLVEPWHDSVIEPEVRWYEDIETAYQSTDVFIGLLTTAFLASDYLEKIELSRMRSEARESNRDFIFILILVDDISLSGVDLEGFHVLKPGGKSVSAYASKKEGFNIAQRELELILLNYQRDSRGRLPSRQRLLSSGGLPVQQGITLLVQGDFINGEKKMNSYSGVTVFGNITNSQVGQTLENCSFAIGQLDQPELKQLLENLHINTVRLLDKLPADQAAETVSDLELAVQTATSQSPSKRRYSVSIAGLLQAAKYVNEIGGELAASVLALGRWLWPDFELPNE